MNILVTDYRNSGDNVMVFIDTDTTEAISANTLAMALDYAGQTYADIYEVPDNEVRFYLYDPLWADESFIRGAKQMARKYIESHK